MVTKWQHVSLKQYMKSTFQGHSADVTTQDNILPAPHAVYMDVLCARATHNIYAYRIKTEAGVFEHYEDEGEFDAGKNLLNILREGKF